MVQMKSLLLADNRLDLLATLEPILKHWGYRVLTANSAGEAEAFLGASTPALGLVGSNLLKALKLQGPNRDLPLVTLVHPDDPTAATSPDLTLPVPVDIFRLFGIIQTHLEKHPRQNLRLRLQLPGMYRFKGQGFVLAEVISLSMEGLFFRSPLRLAVGDRVAAVFPLLGHGREMEVEGQVLYTVEPTPANNYAQGFGLAFEPLSAEQVVQLERFIAAKFLGEVSTCQMGVGTFSSHHLRH